MIILGCLIMIKPDHNISIALDSNQRQFQPHLSLTRGNFERT